jgi:Fe-S cluster assembly scaffold protein SufB
LRTRGIPVRVAQRLLVSGFLNEVIERLDQSAIAAHLNRLIEKKFGSEDTTER